MRPTRPYEVIVIGDYLKDLDDEHTLCGLVGLERLGFISLRCVVGNLAPAELRACGAKGTLNMLGFSKVPVGVGTPVFEGKSYPYEAKVPYLADKHEIELDGASLIIRSLSSCQANSAILILQSGLTDAAQLLQNYPDLLKDKLKVVAIMGGVETDGDSVYLDKNGLMIPNNANNNSFDMESALYLYRMLQLLEIPMIVTTREVAYCAQVPFSAYDEFEATGNPVGVCLKNRQLPALQHLWEAACSPSNSDIRGTLPADRNRQWFINVFCAGKDPGIEDSGDIWPYVGGFNLYDPSNAYAAIPELSNHFLYPTFVKVGKVDHIVYGISPKNNGVLNKNEFADFMVSIETVGLS